ncbi:hypothetical protein GCM10023350_18740 [Nocardioides endophyticus]|uniref:Bacterial Ig-like domain-containing protein n=1 Tax=Nocardioides endophyticus TaxID=1353775 RepID=A0ABP8YR68_9ACTN
MTTSPRPLLASVLTLSLAAAALVATPSPARADWSSSSTAVPEGPVGEEVESDRRLGGELAVARDGTTWFAWVQDAMTSPLPSQQRVLVTKRPAGGSWEAPVVVGTVTRTTNSYPTGNDVELALDGAGRPTVAWNELTGTVAAPTTQTVLVHTRFLGSTGEWGAVTDFSSAMTLNPLEAPLTLDVGHDGAAALAWQGTDGVHLARRADGTWGNSEVVEPTSVAKIPDTVGLGRDQEGRLTLLWRSWDATASAWDVRARVHNGSDWAGAAVTLQEDATVAARATLAVDSSGAAVAAWGTNDGARAAVRTATATGFGSPVTLSSGAANTVADPVASASYRQTAGTGVPSAVFDAYGTATVVWPEASPAPRVAYAEVGRTGAWTDPATLALDGDANTPPAAPKVVVGRDGEAAAVWNRRIAIVGGAFLGGQVVVSERDAGTTSWSAPEVYTTPSNGSYAAISALGLNNSANVGLVGDGAGDVTVAWTPYASHAAAGIQTNQVVDRPGARAASLEWTARGVGGSSNIRSWLNYLRTDWASPGEACPHGLHEVQVADGATMPGAEDDSSWRFAQVGASMDASGRTIVQYDGELRWVMEAHCIDIRLRDPRLEIAADGLTARLYASGLTNGSMSEAIGGNPSTTPFANLRVLEIDLAGAGPRPGGGTDTWLSARATLASAAASTLGLDLYADRPFGFVTVTAPDDLDLAPAMTVTGSTTTTYGAAGTVTVNVPGATGDVVLSGAGADLTQSLVGGTATFALPRTLGAGPHVLTAAYAGDTTYAPRWASHALTVEKATPAVGVSAPAVTDGTAASVTVSVPGATGAVTLTGAGDPVTADLVSGAATLTLPVLPVGSHDLSVAYGGDANNDEATGTATLVVGVAPARSTTTVTLGSPTTRYGTATTATVAVTAPDTNPTGPVSVVVGGRTLTGTLDGGRATLRLPADLTPGQQAVRASYAGADGVTASTGTATLTVAKATPRIRLALVKKRVARSKRAKVTVRVDVPGATGIAPAAKVVIKVGQRTLVTKRVIVGVTGTVTLSLPRLARGSHRLRATIGATPLLLGTTSAVRVLKVR